MLAFVGLHACLRKGGWLRCGRAGALVRAGALSRHDVSFHAGSGSCPRRFWRGFAAADGALKLGTIAAFVVGAVVGFMPHEIGRMVDPYDAYPSQFAADI